MQEETINHTSGPISSPYTGSSISGGAPPPPPTIRKSRARRTPPPPAAPIVVRPVAPSPAPPSGAAQAIMALRTLFTRKRRRKHHNLQYLIENRLEMPVFFIVSFTMIIRASQLFSGGTLVMSRLLGPKYPIFEIVTGLGLGLGSEMLMTIAGRSWKGWGDEATENEARPGMSKAARTAYIKRARQNALWSQRVMFVGMGASVFAGLSFLFTNSGKGISLDTFSDPTWWGQFISDLVATVVVTVCVFYLGVLRETRSMTDAESALADLDEGLNDAVSAAVQRFRDGVQTPVDEKLIAEHLPPGRKAKFLRAVAKINKGKVWTTKEIRKRLGIGNDATQIRAFNRKVNELASDPDNALEKATDGKTWLIPAVVVHDVWGDEIMRKDAERLAASMQLAAA